MENDERPYYKIYTSVLNCGNGGAMMSTAPNRLLLLALVVLCLLTTTAGSQNKPQSKRRPVLIFLDLKETNLNKLSTVAINTLTERLAASRFRVTTNRREAVLVIEGTISSRPSPVTDEAKREGGVNAEATAS